MNCAGLLNRGPRHTARKKKRAAGCLRDAEPVHVRRVVDQDALPL